jgi:hypothetical protein
MPCSKSDKGRLLNFDKFNIYLPVHHPTFMSLDKLCLNIAGNTEAGSDEQDLALGPSANGRDGTILGPHDDSFWRRLP